MKTLYLDLSSGISGDMLVGALLDLGADARQLELKLQALGLEGYHLHITRGQKAGIAALLAMLNSCASGVSVVNIDNGFGAGYAASQINALAHESK